MTEVALDWFVIPKDESERSAFDQIEESSPMRVKGQEVLLVAIHNDTLSNYQTIAKTIGFTVNFTK